MSLHHRTSASSVNVAAIDTTVYRGPVVRRKLTLWERTKYIFPILEWLPKYKRHNLKFDIAAGITVAMMLIPQEVSLANIIRVRPENGLYRAAIAPFVYAVLGSSTVLSVSGGSEVSLLVGSALSHIESEQERVATGIFMALSIGLILLTVRFLNLSMIADFFSRPVMGGFISAGGFLVSLSQVANWLSISVKYSSFPPVTVYRILAESGNTEKHSFLVGLSSIFVLISLKVIKKRCFPKPVLMKLFNEEPETKEEDGSEPILTPVPDASAQHTSHGFSLTDAQYQIMQAQTTDDDFAPTGSPKGKFALWLYFLARTMCDLGPLIVCVVGGIAGYILGPNKIKTTGPVPGGFPEPLVPWYGFNDGFIASEELGPIMLRSLTIAVVIYLSSIAMAKRLAIQRGEDIRTNNELMGLGVASIVCGFFRAMPPTGGMSRTAVNLQNAKTQLASIVTVCIIILSLYTLTDYLQYLPRATLASIIIVAGYALVEFREAKWLYRIRRDEFYVWAASFFLTLMLGVMYGLVASIVSSVVALMWKTKRSPVVILGQLDNGSFVDRELYTDAKHLLDVVVLRVDTTVYFANCERVALFVDDELARLAKDGITVKGVVIDIASMNDLDATTLQVFSDLQEKLAFRKIGLAFSNAKGRVHDIIASTNLIKRIAGYNPRITIEDAIRVLRNLQFVSTASSSASDRVASAV